jgi:hypothetical protein
MRFANRVPLQYQPKACAISEASTRPTGAGYELQQPKGSLPVGPLAIVVHLASVWVPFTSEAKEAVAHYDELLEEMKLALQECGRKLGRTSGRGRRRSRAEAAQPLPAYIPEVSAAIGEILGTPKEKVEKAFTRRAAELREHRARSPEGARRRPATPPSREGPEPAAEPRPRRARRSGRGKRPRRSPAAARSSAALAGRASWPPRRSRRRRRRRPSATTRRRSGKIEKLAKASLRTVTKGDNPAVEIRTRALSNVSFNEKKRIIELGDKAQSREFFNTSMARKFMQTILVASKCKTLIDEGKTVSIRQMYYMTKHTLPGSSENTFEDQDESDPIIEDLEVGIDALREELHLFATRRGAWSASSSSTTRATASTSRAWGAAAGASRASASRRHQVRRLQGRVHPLRREGRDLQRLNEDGFWKKHNCILMTTGGRRRAARGGSSSGWRPS